MFIVQNGVMTPINPLRVFGVFGKFFAEGAELTRPRSWSTTDGRFITSKISAEGYEVTDGEKKVGVSKVYYPHDGEYWVAAAAWDNKLFSEPLHTLDEAVEAAKVLLDTPIS